MPLILLRSVFIVVDIALLWVADTYPTWSAGAQEAVAFLLIIFGPYAELWVFAIVGWGAWGMSKLGSRGREGEYGLVTGEGSEGGGGS